jgi:hypothetical protein
VFTATETLSGVVPDAGEMESQFPPAVLEAAAVQETVEPSEMVNWTVWDGGLDPPRCAENVKAPGEARSEPVAACVMVKIRPPMVSVPVREVVPVFAATE